MIRTVPSKLNASLEYNQYGWHVGKWIFSSYLMPRYAVKSILKFGMLMIIPCIVSLLLLFYSTPEHPYWFFITTALLYCFSGCIYPSASYLASNAISDKASAASMMSFINMGSAMTAVVPLGYLPLSSLMGLIIAIASFWLSYYSVDYKNSVIQV